VGSRRDCAWILGLAHCVGLLQCSAPRAFERRPIIAGTPPTQLRAAVAATKPVLTPRPPSHMPAPSTSRLDHAARLSAFW
jgi:hypothetical protein